MARYNNATRFIWFRRLDGVGEEGLDLAGCRRFVLAWYAVEWDAEFTLVYFMTPCGRWVKLVGDKDWESERDEFIYTESFEEVDPREAAHELLWRHGHKYTLPPGLDQYREFGDFQVYGRWLHQASQPGLPALSDAEYAEAARTDVPLPLALRRRGKKGQKLVADFIEFMESRSEATFEEVQDAVYGGRITSDKAIKQLGMRAKKAQISRRSRVSYRCAGSRIFKEISPE